MTKYSWIDSYLGNKNKQIGTYPYKSPTRRIDHVFYFGAGIKPTSWDTLDGSIDISDHKPVLVNFEIEAATSGEKIDRAKTIVFDFLDFFRSRLRIL